MARSGFSTKRSARRNSTRPPVFSGYSVNTDTFVAAAEAYMAALNKLLASREERIKAERAAYAAGYDAGSASYAVDAFGRGAEAPAAE